MSGSTTRDDIRAWLAGAMSDPDNRWMLVMHDTFSADDYPVCVTDVENYAAVVLKATKNGDRVHEVYDLDADIEEQLDERRAWHGPA